MEEPAPGLKRLRAAAKWRMFRGNADIKSYVGVGLAPAVAIGRTGLDSELDLEGSGVWTVPARGRFGDGDGAMTVGYASLRERGTGNHVGWTQMDVGMGMTDGIGYSGATVHWTVGYSALFVDFDGGGRDTVGLGAFARVDLDALLWRRWGIGLFADAHGWLGFDSHGAHLAGSASVGANIICTF